jgi:hypothetical protein
MFSMRIRSLCCVLLAGAVVFHAEQVLSCSLAWLQGIFIKLRDCVAPWLAWAIIGRCSATVPTRACLDTGR